MTAVDLYPQVLEAAAELLDTRLGWAKQDYVVVEPTNAHAGYRHCGHFDEAIDAIRETKGEHCSVCAFGAVIAATVLSEEFVDDDARESFLGDLLPRLDLIAPGPGVFSFNDNNAQTKGEVVDFLRDSANHFRSEEAS